MTLALIALLAALSPTPSQAGSVLHAIPKLIGQVAYDVDCTPAMVSFLDKSVAYAKTAAASPAFRECITRSFKGGAKTADLYVPPYRRCKGDPFYDEPVETQIAKVLEIAVSPNSVEMKCTGGKIGNASAGVGKYGHEDAERFQWSGWLAAVTPAAAEKSLGWPVCDGKNGPDCRYAPYPWPFTQAAGIVWHEAFHTHGYIHGANEQEPAKKACGYEKDPTWNFQENTVPYIVQECIGQVLALSGQKCGARLEQCKTSGELLLIKTLESAKCECRPIPAVKDESRRMCGEQSSAGGMPSCP
ncbi:MAG: hypothetical protein HY075_16715 [Deltaproteobacteria bacterium]|nr:hypothetical protein [Deltaproteobacteria bacterium]